MLFLSYAWIRKTFMYPLDSGTLAILKKYWEYGSMVPSECATQRRLHADPGVCAPARREQFQKISFACLLKVA